MDNSFKSIVDQSQSILILLPTDPVFDEVAAGLSLYLSLTKVGKEISVVCPTPMLVEFNRLVGVNGISTTISGGTGNNLIIRFKNYQAENIDKVSYDIENGEFKLSVIPKSGQLAPKKEQMDVQFSGGSSAQTVLLMGGEGEQSFPLLSSDPEISKAKLVFFGIQAPKFNPDRQIISFARPVSSVTEIAASIIKEGAFPVDVDIATNLLLGIELSSNNFTLSGVSAETFQLVSDLLKMGGKREPLAFAKQQAAQLQQMMQNPEAQKKFQQQLQQLQQSMPNPQGANQPVQQQAFQQAPAQQTENVTQTAYTQPMTQQQTYQAPQQTTVQPDYQQPVPAVAQVADNAEAKEGIVENPPADWLNPKIYKGTSVS